MKNVRTIRARAASNCFENHQFTNKERDGVGLASPSKNDLRIQFLSLPPSLSLSLPFSPSFRHMFETRHNTCVCGTCMLRDCEILRCWFCCLPTYPTDWLTDWKFGRLRRTASARAKCVRTWTDDWRNFFHRTDWGKYPGQKKICNFKTKQKKTLFLCWTLFSSNRYRWPLFQITV